MSSGFALSLIILAVVSANLYFILQSEGGVAAVPHLLTRVGITLPTPASKPKPATPPKLPSSFTSGVSRFSQGACTNDADCVVSGCSSEVCGAEPAITTCEFSESFPNTKKYNCGCNHNKCAWEAK